MGFQTINDPYGGNVFGRIGKGIGQGLSEQLPKEIERGRLSSGLKEIQANPGATPLDRLIQLYSTPGITPEMAHQIEPYLRSAATQQRGRDQRGGQRPQGATPAQPGMPASAQGGGGAAPTPQQPGQQSISPIAAAAGATALAPTAGGGEPTIVPSSSEAAQRQQVYRASPQDIENEAFRLMEMDPNLYPDYASAEAKAERNLNYVSETQQEAINAAQRQESQQTKVDTEFDSLIDRKLGDLKGLLPEETFRRIQRKVDSDVLGGKSRRQAIEERSTEALDLAKAANSLANNIGTRPFFGSAPTQMIKDLKSIKRTFAKAGELETFKNLAKNKLDIGDHLSNYTAFTPTKKLEEGIVNTSSKDSPAKIASKLAKDIGDADSLFSLGYLLNKVGVDDAAVVDELQRMYNDGEINLNSRQARELGEYYPLQPRLGDILWSTTTGLSGLSGFLANYLTGSRKKVGPMQQFKQLLGKE